MSTKMNTYMVLVQGLFSLVAVVAFAQEGDVAPVDDPAASDEVRVMAFNVWASGSSSWHDPAWSNGSRGAKVAELIHRSGAHIVCLQEYAHMPPPKGLDHRYLEHALEALQPGVDWHCVPTARRRHVLTTLDVLESDPAKPGARLRLPDGSEAVVFSVHIGLQRDWGNYYIPYAAAKRNDDGGFLYSESELIDRATRNWDNPQPKKGEKKKEDLPWLASALKAATDSGVTVFLAGDCNEPSHLDWTPAAVKAGLVPQAVRCPFSVLLTEQYGLIDSYHEDRLKRGKTEVSRRGFTWTPGAARRKRVNDDDRIDFVYYRSDRLRLITSEVYGEPGGVGVDVEIGPRYPSDHRAVLSTFKLVDPKSKK